ncbi:MAG: hypothetical protein ACI82H_001882, partial [Alphaproteobacteria bacterium]
AGFTPLAISGGKRGFPRATTLLRQASLPQGHGPRIGGTCTPKHRQHLA